MKKIDFLLFKALGYNPQWVNEDLFLLNTVGLGAIKFDIKGQPYVSSSFIIQVGDEKLTKKILNNIHKYIKKQELRLNEVKALLSKSDEEKKQIIMDNFDTLLTPSGEMI